MDSPRVLGGGSGGSGGGGSGSGSGSSSLRSRLQRTDLSIATASSASTTNINATYSNTAAAYGTSTSAGVSDKKFAPASASLTGLNHHQHSNSDGGVFPLPTGGGTGTGMTGGGATTGPATGGYEPPSPWIDRSAIPPESPFLANGLRFSPSTSPMPRGVLRTHALLTGLANQSNAYSNKPRSAGPTARTSPVSRPLPTPSEADSTGVASTAFASPFTERLRAPPKESPFLVRPLGSTNDANGGGDSPNPTASSSGSVTSNGISAFINVGRTPPTETRVTNPHPPGLTGTCPITGESSGPDPTGGAEIIAARPSAVGRGLRDLPPLRLQNIGRKRSNSSTVNTLYTVWDGLLNVLYYLWLAVSWVLFAALWIILSPVGLYARYQQKV